MRALIGAFAQANHTQFNRSDGAGYDFVADFVLALDPKNPQVAARLMGAFRSWRALEARRAASARKPRSSRVAGRRCSRAMSRDIVARTLGRAEGVTRLRHVFDMTRDPSRGMSAASAGRLRRRRQLPCPRRPSEIAWVIILKKI